jgi:single-strand DNA-binding protein
LQPHLCIAKPKQGLAEINKFLKPSLQKIYRDTKRNIMYALKNKVQLIGNLGNAPEVRNTESGKKLVRFSVATNEQYKNAKGERVTETQWHNLIAWGKLADIAEKYLVKGTEVAIEGKLVNRNYMDKEGNKKYVTEIQVNELLMLGKATGSMVA